MTDVSGISGQERWAALEEPTAVESNPKQEEAAEPESGESRFFGILRAMGSEIDRGENLIRGALGSGPLDAGSLIALQAGIYRWGEVVDLASKLVDRAGSAVRTTLQNGNG